MYNLPGNMYTYVHVGTVRLQMYNVMHMALYMYMYDNARAH